MKRRIRSWPKRLAYAKLIADFRSLLTSESLIKSRISKYLNTHSRQSSFKSVIWIISGGIENGTGSVDVESFCLLLCGLILRISVRGNLWVGYAFRLVILTPAFKQTIIQRSLTFCYSALNSLFVFLLWKNAQKTSIKTKSKQTMTTGTKMIAAFSLCTDDSVKNDRGFLSLHWRPLCENDDESFVLREFCGMKMIEKIQFQFNIQC